MVIGITGPTGAGKTTALACLGDMGYTIIDCDAVYHRLLKNSAQLKNKLFSAFPACESGGRVDRKKLAAIVFADTAALERLNEITHAAVRAEVLRLLDELPKGADAAIDAVALIAGGLKSLCDVTVAVLAPEETRLRRIMARDGLSPQQARQRLDAQRPDCYYMENCSVCLNNTFADINEFYKQCAELFRQLKEEIHE